jgi:hypothetical protein
MEASRSTRTRVHVLHLSNSEAFYRITAARIARRFPIVFALVEQRQLHLTAVCLLRDYLTTENHSELLSAAVHKTKWQVQELIAHRFPRLDVESRVRRLPARRAVPSSSAAVPSSSAAVPSSSVAIGTTTTTPEVLRSSLPRITLPKPIEPLSEARYRIQLNASAGLKDKLDRLRP